MTRRYICTTALALCIAITGAEAQPSDSAAIAASIIPETVTCASCYARGVPIAVISSEAATGAIRSKPRAVRMDPAGRIWVISDSTPLRVYKPDGQFMGMVGELGTLPRQYRWPVDVMWTPGDSMLVFEGVRSPALLLSPDWKFVRRVHLPAQLRAGAVLSWPNAVLAHGVMWNATRPAPPVHLVSFDTYGAEILHSYGKPRATELMSGVDVHFAAAGQDVITAPASRYLLQRWNARGELQQSWERRAWWFQEADKSGIGSATEAPSPAIAGLDFSKDSLLWVYTHVPAPNWRSAWRAGTVEYERLYRTRVEVIDLARGRVVARGDLNGMVVSVLGNGRIALLSPGQPGLPKLSVQEMLYR